MFYMTVTYLSSSLNASPGMLCQMSQEFHNCICSRHWSRHPMIPKLCMFWSNHATMKPPKELQKLIYSYTSNCNNPVSTCNIHRRTLHNQIERKASKARWQSILVEDRRNIKEARQNLLADGNHSASACFLILLMFIYLTALIFLLPSASCRVLCSFRRRHVLGMVVI